MSLSATSLSTWRSCASAAASCRCVVKSFRSLSQLVADPGREQNGDVGGNLHQAVRDRVHEIWIGRGEALGDQLGRQGCKVFAETLRRSWQSSCATVGGKEEGDCPIVLALALPLLLGREFVRR